MPSRSRRVRVAIDGGYLRNLKDKRGRPAWIALGDPLPDDVPILPTVEVVMQRCSDGGGVCSPPPSPAADATVADACRMCGVPLLPGLRHVCADCERQLRDVA